jgi:hypothetical protein
VSEADSVFEYLYRDASNYKAYGSAVLTGRATDGDVAKVEGKLTTDGIFIPEFVGLKPLQAQLDGFPSGEDHIWHEYVGLRPACPGEVEELDCWGTVQVLIERFSALPEWTSHEMLSRIRLLLQQEPYSLMR